MKRFMVVLPFLVIQSFLVIRIPLFLHLFRRIGDARWFLTSGATVAPDDSAVKPLSVRICMLAIGSGSRCR
jgi:hypothetical protein